jgi:hypothetical protein
VRRPDSPAPTGNDLRRLIGTGPGNAVRHELSPVPPDEIGLVHPGTVEVEIAARHCDIPVARKPLVIPADSDPLPLWFVLTPHRVGDFEVSFELWQDGARIAAVTHPIRTTRGAEGTPAALTRSHGRVGLPLDELLHATAQEEEAGEPLIDFDHDPFREGGEHAASEDEPAAPPLVSGDRVVSEVLDGVQDSLQSGEPPEEEDDPLLRPEPPAPESGGPAGRSPDEGSAAVPKDEPPPLPQTDRVPPSAQKALSPRAPTPPGPPEQESDITVPSRSTQVTRPPVTRVVSKSRVTSGPAAWQRWMLLIGIVALAVLVVLVVWALMT